MKKCIIVFMLLLGGLSAQGVSYNEEFQVNTYTDNNQYNPELLSLPDGRFVVCWESDGQDGSGYGVFGQIFTNDGERIGGTEFQVNTYTDNDQYNPELLSLPDGRFVICWKSYGQDGSGYGVFGQIFNSDGERIGSEFQVNTYTDGRQCNLELLSLPDGKFVVCWDSWYQNGYDGYDGGIFGKYYYSEPLEHELKDFEVVSPRMDESLDIGNPDFRWNKANEKRMNFSWEVVYDLYISFDEEFSNPLIYSDIQDTVFHLPEGLEKGKTYFWKVKGKTCRGDTLWSSNVNGFYVKEDAVPVEEKEALEKKGFQLKQNYPNPFHLSTTIAYTLTQGGEVNLTVYSIDGREVEKLVEEYQEAGEYESVFHASGLSSGIYFYQLRIGMEIKETKKMMFLK